jgi:hypothetical protein
MHQYDGNKSKCEVAEGRVALGNAASAAPRTGRRDRAGGDLARPLWRRV